MRYVTNKDQDQDFFSTLLDLIKEEPVVVRQGGEDVAVVLSPEAFARYASRREAKVEALRAMRDRLSDKAERNGLTEEALADILADG